MCALILAWRMLSNNDAEREPGHDGDGFEDASLVPAAGSEHLVKEDAPVDVRSDEVGDRIRRASRG